MTIAINGTTYDYLNLDPWITQPAGMYLNGDVVLLNQRILTLSGSVMPTTDYDVIQALKGTAATVTACAYDSMDSVTYYDCVIDNVTGSHDGPNMTNVSVVVKVSL